MKKIFTLAAIAMLAVGTAQAQWKPSDTDYVVVGQDSIYDQTGLKMLTTPEGNIVTTWLKTPVGMKRKDPAFGYYLHMQVFDKDGNATFGRDGMMVCAKSGLTYTTDYGLTLADNGDIVIAYYDARTDSTHEDNHPYAYRFTQNGTPVWDKEGIRFNLAPIFVADGDEASPTIASSGDYTYIGAFRTEYYKVKADSTNWTPSRWQPTMPDSIDTYSIGYELQCINADGTMAWAEPKIFDIGSSYAAIYAAPNGGVYVLYANAGLGLSARLIGSDGNDVWSAPVTVETATLGNSMRFEAPAVESDGKGGLMISYRVLKSLTGAIAINRLQPDGTVYPDASGLLCNGTDAGNGTYPQVAVRDDHAVVAWTYKDTEGMFNLMVNKFDIAGDYVWEGDSLLGFPLAKDDAGEKEALKVFALTDGWLVIYKEPGESWNGGDYYCTKIDDAGNTVWKKMIGESNLRTTNITAACDGKQAYVLYTATEESDGEPTPGGLRMLVVDIANSTTTGIDGVSTITKATEAQYFTTSGARIGKPTAPGLYIVKDANGTRKIAVKGI